MDAAKVEKQTIRSANWWDLLLGIWLVISPFVLNYTRLEPALWNDIAAGLAVGLLVLVRVTGLHRPPGFNWLHVLLGFWLIVSPSVLGFSNYITPLWNNVISGLLVGILGLKNFFRTSAELPNSQSPSQ